MRWLKRAVEWLRARYREAVADDRGLATLEIVIIAAGLGAAAILVVGAVTGKIGEFIDALQGL